MRSPETLEEFVEVFAPQVRTVFMREGHLTPMWFCESAEGKLAIVATPFETPRQKDAVSAKMGEFMVEHKIIRYCLVVEVWMVAMKDDATARALGPHIVPSEHRDREEFIHMVGEDWNGKQVSRMWPITRDGGKHGVGEEVKDGVTMIEGRFIGLLQKNKTTKH